MPIERREERFTTSLATLSVVLTCIRQWVLSGLMERWKALYSLLGCTVLALTGGLALAMDMSLIPAGLGFVVGIAVLFLTVRPTAYAPVLGGIGVSATVTGGHLLLTDAPVFGGLLAVVGLAAVGRGVQIRRATADA